MIRKIFFLPMLFLLLFVGCSGNGNSKNDKSAVSEQPINTETGLEIGQKAPDLSYESPEGKIISLSSLNGKMVLIDFWASWCMPCRIENPNLVKVYNNYKDKSFKSGEGFTIYSVSLDTEKSEWVNGIEKDGLAWEFHVSDLKGWKAEGAKTYNVFSIPANFLIDGNGIIVAKNLRAEALEEMMRSLVK